MEISTMINTQDTIGRKIIISEQISDGLAERVIEHILMINEYDDQMSIVNGYEPPAIEIYINSTGGSATAGNAILSVMEMSETPIVTYGLGIVASMALAIFIAGDYRIAHRFCRFMYHSVAYGTEGYIKDHEDQLAEAKILQEMYNSTFLDRTKLSVSRMNEIRNGKKDFFFSGKLAVKLGVADKLLEKPVREVKIIEEELEESEKEIKFG